jgi:hypothetical protein
VGAIVDWLSGRRRGDVDLAPEAGSAGGGVGLDLGDQQAALEQVRGEVLLEVLRLVYAGVCVGAMGLTAVAGSKSWSPLSWYELRPASGVLSAADVVSWLAALAGGLIALNVALAARSTVHVSARSWAAQHVWSQVMLAAGRVFATAAVALAVTSPWLVAKPRWDVRAGLLTLVLAGVCVAVAGTMWPLGHQEEQEALDRRSLEALDERLSAAISGVRQPQRSFWRRGLAYGAWAVAVLVGLSGLLLFEVVLAGERVGPQDVLALTGVVVGPAGASAVVFMFLGWLHTQRQVAGRFTQGLWLLGFRVAGVGTVALLVWSLVHGDSGLQRLFQATIVLIMLGAPWAAAVAGAQNRWLVRVVAATAVARWQRQRQGVQARLAAESLHAP